MISLYISSICTAFNKRTIGTKVTNHLAFEGILAQALGTFDMPISGQGLVPMDSALDFVSPGVARIGPEPLDPDDFLVRYHRGKWGVYARRELASPADSLKCVVFTLNAYLEDPDLTAEEIVLAMKSKATHVIVAVLATTGPKAPLPIQTLIHNIAGGNNEFIPKTEKGGVLDFAATLNLIMQSDTVPLLAHDLALLHTIIHHAKESEQYWSEWMIVAD